MKQQAESLRLLFLSSALGPLGSGLGGGVEFKIKNLAQEMTRRRHQVTVAAVTGSKLAHGELVEIEGNAQTNAYALGRQSPITMPVNPAQANILDYARRVQSEYDVIVSFAYEWLPLYLTPFFQTPLAHFISLPSLMDFMDEMLCQIATHYPYRLAVNTKAQTDTYSFGDLCEIVGSGVDLPAYDFQPNPKHQLAWVARITPEKGLEDAFAVADRTGIPLKVFGVLQDESYWQRVCAMYPDAPVEYRGFLDTPDFQAELGECRALLMTHRWVEAFGNVAIEALACGVPVISYRKGGPAEIVRHGETGWLVAPDDIAGVVAAVDRLPEIQRAACREQAERAYSIEAMGARYEAWFRRVIAAAEVSSL